MFSLQLANVTISAYKATAQSLQLLKWTVQQLAFQLACPVFLINKDKQ